MLITVNVRSCKVESYYLPEVNGRRETVDSLQFCILGSQISIRPCLENETAVCLRL